MRTITAGFALLGALAVAQGTQAQTPNAPQNTPGVSGPVPGSAAPGMPGAPAVGTPSTTGQGNTGTSTTMGTTMDTTVGTPTAPPTGTATTPSTGSGVVDRNTGKAAAGGETNQAVATTNANASQPAHGANSFTMGEAQRRIAGKGYENVSALTKDDQGVWRGTATKDGKSVPVALDYQGNVIAQ